MGEHHILLHMPGLTALLLAETSQLRLLLELVPAFPCSSVGTLHRSSSICFSNQHLSEDDVGYANLTKKENLCDLNLDEVEGFKKKI